MFIIRDREAGNLVCSYSTREEAEKALAEFEAEDKKDGIYEPDFYEIINQDEKVVVNLTTEEKLDRIGKMTAAELLDALDYYHRHWNPIDKDMWESRDLVKAEIIRRMEQ